jgi:hypothetical protein
VLGSECTDNRVPELTRISQAQRMAGPRHSQVLRKQENRKEDKLLSGVHGESNAAENAIFSDIQEEKRKPLFIN